MLHTKNKSEQAHSPSSNLTLADITNQAQNSPAEPDAAFPEFFSPRLLHAALLLDLYSEPSK